jgi:hypothetical protein
MYLGETIAGAGLQDKATLRPPFGPGFSATEAADADKMEVWHTQFKDPGPDYSEFRLFKGGRQVGSKRIDGY